MAQKKNQKRQIFRGATMIYRRPGSPEDYIDASFIGLFYSAMQELLDEEQAEVGEGEILDRSLHSLAVETLPKNPYRIVKDQHVISRKHLAWFANSDGKVCVLEKGHPRIKHIYTKNAVFCAFRVWSNDAEQWMQPIEREFYKLARRAMAAVDEGEPFLVMEQDVVTEYWALCRARVRVRRHPPRPFNLAGHEREPYSQEEKDALESQGLAIYSTEGDETRAVATVMVLRLMLLDKEAVKAQGVAWRVVVSPNDTVVLPDYLPGLAVPIRHNMLFFGEVGSSEVLAPRGELVNADELASHYFNAAKSILVARSESTLLRFMEVVAAPGGDSPPG